MFKKLLLIILVVLFCFSTACAKQSALLPYVSELRLDVYEGTSDDYHLKANFGYHEKLKNHDGKVSEKTYCLAIILVDCNLDGKISATIELNGEKFTQEFVYNPVSSKMIAVFPTDAVPKTFDVTISHNGQSQTVTLNSTVPESAISYKKALESFESQQPALIQNYTVNGTFIGEIAMRIIVKDGAPYWYLGLIDSNGKTKALLIDGTNGNILAIKDVF